VLITLKAHVKSDAAVTTGFITLDAKADPTNAITEPNNANNNQTATTAVLP
jgi:hypothetical protein